MKTLIFALILILIALAIPDFVAWYMGEPPVMVTDR